MRKRTSRACSALIAQSRTHYLKRFARG